VETDLTSCQSTSGCRSAHGKGLIRLSFPEEFGFLMTWSTNLVLQMPQLMNSAWYLWVFLAIFITLQEDLQPQGQHELLN